MDVAATKQPNELKRALENFIRFRDYGTTQIEHSPIWPGNEAWIADLLIFSHFHWARVHTTTDCSLIGIRSTSGPALFTEEVLQGSHSTICLSRDSPKQANMRSTARFYIAELPSRSCFGISTYAWSAPRRWRLLNERILKVTIQNHFMRPLLIAPLVTKSGATPAPFGL